MQRPSLWHRLRLFRSLCVALVFIVGTTSLAKAATFTVTKTADTDDLTCDADCSLREAITAANTTGGSHTIAFNIPIAAGAAVIAPISALPAITRNNITIDGTTQTANNGNTNPLSFGTGGTVGVDALPLSQVAGPEVEIRGDSSILFGLQVQASNVTIRGLAIFGFSAGGGAGIRIDDGANGVVIEENLLGSPATSFADPGVALRNNAAIDAVGGDNGTVRNNVMGFAEVECINLDLGSNLWTIEGNECRDSGVDDDNGDGVAINLSNDNSITGNLITGSSTQGFVDTGSTGTSVENNTITGNGVGSFAGGFPSQGVAIRSTTSNATYYRNIIHANYGAGLSVNDGATGITISENSFADNGTILARDLSPATGQIGVDLNIAGDDSNLGNPNYYTPNTAADTLQDFPILETAIISNSNLILTGWSTPLATIELFISDGDGFGFGEGETHVGTFFEGTADADAGASTYGPGLINGLNQGTGTTDRFSFTVPLPAGIADGTELTATATLGNNTSEFSGIVAAVAVSDISGRVFEDVFGDALNDGAINSANNPGAGDVTVRLYLDTGDSIPNAADTFLTSTTTDATPGATLGTYSFTSLVAGTYFVAVDSQTMDAPNAGLHVASFNTGVWAEQTYGGVGSYCANGAGGTTLTTATGTCYGGRRGDVSDANTDAETAEHVIRVTLGGNATDVDMGLSFNVFVNTSVATAASSNTTRSDQGSLDQALRNAADIIGPNALRFVPTTPTNASGAGGSWWSIDYDNLGTEEEPHRIEDIDTVLDGTAFDIADGITPRDTNPGFLGSNAAGGEVVGVSGFALPQVEKPELELIGRLQLRTFAATRSPENAIIRNLAIWGNVANALIDISHSAALPAPNILIENIVAGSRPDVFADAGTSSSRAIWTRGPVEDGTIRNNLLGFQGSAPAIVQIDPGWIIENNEFAGANLGVFTTEGNLSIRRNLFNGTSGNILAGPTPQPFEENTIRNATGNGLTLRSDGHTVQRNIFENGTSHAVGVSHDQGPPTPAHNNRITDNIFTNNGSVAIDLFDSATGEDQVTPNDGTTTVGSGNQAIDYPIIDSAALVGGNLTVTGFARPGTTIEFYEAVGAANDNNAAGNPHGEGVALLFTATEGTADADATTGASYTNPGYGTDTNANRFSFTVAAPAGLAIGDDISSTAYLAGSGTSEFGPNFTVTGLLVSISGSVFEDITGNVLDGAEAINDVANPVVSGVDVYLYLDDGGTPGSPDATDTVQNGGAPVVTDASGVFTFPNIADGTYWTVVDSRTVAPSAGVHPSYLATTPWAEQTFGPDNGWCADGTGGTTERVGAGPCFGGIDGATDDDATALTSSEHVARVVVSGAAVTNVDFGFSFNVVSNVEPAGNASLTASTYQGSIDQFVRNANSVNGANAMRFVPAVATNAAGGGGWWRVDYTGSIIGETVTNTHDADTSINGIAYDLADGVTVRNTNPGNLGANAGGGLTVGTDDVALPQVARPELEVMRSDSAAGVAFYFYSNAATGQIPDNYTVRDIAMWGFVGGVGMTGVATMRPSGVVVERNVIGSPPNGFVDPAIAGTQHGVAFISTDGATVRDNLIGFVDANGVSASASAGTAITGNEIRDTGQADDVADGINYGGTSTTGTITANLVVDSGGMGIDGTATVNLIQNNTVTGSGQRGVQTGGIRQTGSSNTLRRNIVTGSIGPGIIVPDTVNAIEVTENRFGGNGSIAIDLIEAGGATATGDGVMLNDGAFDAADGNDGLDYPIIESAQISGPNLVLNGFALPGSIIEFYIADTDPSGFGEGVTYLLTLAEGTAADTDATSGTYGPGAINGLAQGTATTNRFSFTVPVPGGVGVGSDLTATATIANATSEFSGRATISNDTDLMMTKVLDASTPGPFAEGDPVTYLLTVINNGTVPATNVTATDTYPSELTLGAAVPSAPTTYVAGTGVWTIGTLDSGASATLLLPGTVNAGTAGNVVTNSVTAASGDQPDATTSDDLVETFTVLPFLSIDDVAQAETDSGTTVFTFTVSINQAVDYDVTFDFDTADNTATVADSDYVAIAGGSGTITIGSNSTTVDVTVNGDPDIEADETFFVNFSNVVGAAVADAQGQGTLNNDDSATVSVAATVNANEAGPVNGQFTVTQSTTSDTDTVVSYTIAGTATAGGTDYTTLSGTVTVVAGATAAAIDVTGIVTDALVEGTETVIVTLTGTDNVTITAAASPNDAATVSIIDADTANISIAATTDANEAGPVDGQFTVTQSVTSIADTVVSYTVAGTATAGGTDYATLSGTVTVLAGDLTATIDVTGIVADALVEGTETVVVTLTGTDNVAITVAASPADAATVNIIDASGANVSIAATSDANEAGPVNGQFTVTQSTTSASDTVVNYTVAGTATAGDTDYTTLSGSVTVLAGATTATIDVTGIVADALVEGTETIVVTLTATDNVAITVAASPDDTATVDILDNNNASVSIAPAVNANESGPVDGQFTVTQSATSATDTVITYTVAGTATAGGTDYVSLSGTVTVVAGATAATVDVTGIVTDALVEGTETVIVTLTGTNNVAITVAASPNDAATVSIIDADTANVSIAATTDANEAGPVDGQFTVTQSTTSGTDTVISYSVAGTAAAGGSDYATLSGTVTILAADTTATIDVTGIVADTLVEGTETVVVTLTGTDNAGITVAASPADTATVDILDASGASVSIAATTDANEAGPVNGQFTLTQSTLSASDTVVNYTVAGTATAGGIDYTTLSGSVTVLAGATTAVIDVTDIVADALIEGSETVIVTLTGTDNLAITVASSPADTATINILDNNGATASIGTTTDGNETGPVDGQFTVTQSATSATDTVVSYTVAGTATAAGTDYTSLSGSVTVFAGTTTATIDVTGIVADALVEGTETVIVTLSGTDNPAISVAASPNDTATVNILDSNAATVSIAATTNGAESGPVNGVFTVTQSATAVNDTVLSYAVAGTATSGSDYTALSGTVTIPGGATTATITVPVIDDAVAEGVDETVEITLSSITAGDPGVSIAANPADTASHTIVDNDTDLITTKSVSNATPQEGDSITYTLTVNNSAGVQATNVSLNDVLPSGVTYVSDDSGGSYSSTTGVWNIGTLDDAPPANVISFNITATVDVGASALAQPITNTTTAATGDQADPDTSTDVLSASITVNANADLVTTKIVDNASPVENATIVYTITVFNNGAAQATNVSLTDLLPTGISYVSDDTGGAYNPVTGVWTIGTIDNSAIATLNITATVDTGAGALAQPITNMTTAAIGDQPDPDTTTDDLTEDVTVNYSANIVTTKTVDVVTPMAGDTIIYTLMATNNGPAPATNVSLTDLLPSGVTYVSDDGAGAYNDATGGWTIGDIANSGVATLNISAIVDAGAGLLPQPITNTTTAAIGDQADGDTTGDDLAAEILVSLVDPNLIQLTKTVGRNRATAGEIVSYSIEIRNTGANPIGVVRISDSPARGFKYVPGTAQLDGIPVSDPSIGLPLGFNVGTLPGFVDGNGNGIADPGEPGYAVLSYRMVAGSGVAAGVWTNTAVATATCDSCFVSNITSANIEIIEDTVFDLGTIIGKVFYDGDGDGWQDSGEAGIEAAMVALDDGTYVLTDEFGRFHFPAVNPGQRLMKINLSSLPGQAKATNGKTRLVSVTPGLMAKANFGVIIDTVDAAIGDDGQYGIAVDSKTSHPPVLINGSTLMPSLLVNGEPVALASADVKLGKHKIRDVVELDDGKLTAPIRFSTKVDANSEIKRWKLIVTGARDEIAKTWKGKGTPPDFIEWDGVQKNGKLINSGGVFTYHLELTTNDGQAISSVHRLFGVNRLNSISLNLAGGAFISASHELTRKAKNLLSETASAIRAYPDEIVVINGHTDSVGSDESNMALAERRARSAYDYLRKEEGLPEEQFVIQAFGEARPIAGNDTAWGRELNRRVEIKGELDSVDRARNFDPFRRPPVVRINAADIEIDARGAFRTELDQASEQETMNIVLTTPQGRSVSTEVRLPSLHVISPQGRIAIPIDQDTASLAAANGEGLVLHTDLLGRTEPGNIVEFDRERLDVDENGLFIAQLTLRRGENYYGLVARSPMGMLRIVNLKLTLEDANINAPEFVVEPIPQLALQLPPRGIPMTSSNLVVPGTTIPGNRVFINDNEIKVGADGSFTTTVNFERGDNPFTARVVDQDGHSGQIEQVFDYNGDPMFFMALVDGTFSKLQTAGSLEAAGKVEREETISEGRIAYYLKGHVLGKYLLTSAFDSGKQELGEIFSDLTAQDNDRLLTNLDPDTLYPVYGDNSTLVYDAQSQSKFYLALESDTITALIGNYALNFTDTELAGYQRTLYGASATYQSEAKDESGNSKTKVQAFYAKIEQAHVRDELRATGGSLYYLSQRGVIEGSEHISVIVRDQDSGLILRRTALQQGLDYSIDYVDGRLLTNRPISSFSADNSLIASDLLGGSAVYLQIDYETVLDGFEQTATGARVRQGIGERLALGVTTVDEDQVGGQYSLQAADAEYKLAKNSRLLAEFATSEGNNSAINVSEDGGLTYQTVIPVAGSSGDAFKIAAELDIGEWFGVEDRLSMNTYFKRLDTGFSANSVASEQGSEKSGLGASWDISESNSLLGRFERQKQLAGGTENTLATLQWNFVRKLWGATVEIEDRGGYAGDATIAALRMSNRWTDTLSTTLEHQATLSGLENDQSTVGVAYRATDKLTLDASATHGTQGDSAQVGAQLDVNGNRIYVAQQVNDLAATGTSNNRLVGIEAPFGQDGAIYSEYHWSRLSTERQKQAMFGARQRFQATDGLRIEVSGEHSSANAANANTGERYALAIGATYDNDAGITLATRNEYRRDSRNFESEQFLSTSNMTLALGDDLAVIGKYRFSKSDSSVQLNRNIDFTEASIGLAYRPVEHDRLNLLTRFSRLTNTPTEFQQASTIAGVSSDIFSVDWSYQLSQRIEWVGKQAMRWSESDDDPLQMRSRTSLSIQRINWSMPMQLRFGTEYRLMHQDIANDRRKGFVTELMWDGLDPIVFGAGYNFSDVSDNEYVDYDFSTKGPFFRLQGRF